VYGIGNDRMEISKLSRTTMSLQRECINLLPFYLPNSWCCFSCPQRSLLGPRRCCSESTLYLFDTIILSLSKLPTLLSPLNA
jgi:hypothetical protein